MRGQNTGLLSNHPAVPRSDVHHQGSTPRQHPDSRSGGPAIGDTPAQLTSISRPGKHLNVAAFRHDGVAVVDPFRGVAARPVLLTHIAPRVIHRVPDLGVIPRSPRAGWNRFPACRSPRLTRSTTGHRYAGKPLPAFGPVNRWSSWPRRVAEASRISPLREP